MKHDVHHHPKSLVVLLSLAVFFAAVPVASQVYMVEDINSGPGGTYEFRAGALGSYILFSAYDGVHGEELWRSDGTTVDPIFPEGTYLIKDIWPTENNDDTGAYSSKPEQFIAGTSLMYFVAAHQEIPGDSNIPPNHEINLWMSNGQVGNASIVPGLQMALSNSASDAVVMGGLLFIAGWDETSGIELWKTNGTTSSRVTEIEPGDGGSNPTYLTVVGSQLFFSGSNSATSGIELWVTDGTQDGETLIDIVPGTGSSSPRLITAFLGDAYFAAETVDEGMELWTSDGTEGGTTLVADIYSGTESSGPLDLMVAGTQLFFTADDGSHGRELWVTDGTGAGTQMVSDIIENGSIGIWEKVAYDGKLFFVTTHPDSGRELWVSDGTQESTHLLKDIHPGTYQEGEEALPNSSDPTELTVAGDFLFFSANDGIHGPSLWVSDGTSAGTFMVANLFDYWSEEGPKGLTATTDRLFFQTESDLGREVHALLTANVVSPPAAPTGEDNGSTESAYTYSTTGGSISLDGSSVQYRFNWGDDSDSGWLEVGVKSAEHTWTEGDTYDVTVQARSVDTPEITSNASDALSVSMAFNESVNAAITSGPETGEIWVEYEFTVTGESDYGHDLESQVNWGDGEVSEWAAFNATSGETLTHDWDDLGENEIVVTIRCSDHTDVTDSASHWITIGEETIEAPSIDGPTSGEMGIEYDFTIGGESSANHNLEYIVLWADGSDTGWTAFGAGVTSAEASHTWESAETFAIEVCVRCADHTDLQSCTYGDPIEISEPPEEALTGPDVQHNGGDWNGYPDISYSFTLAASSNLEHDLEYQVDWGDGDSTSWTSFGDGLTSIQLAHTWDGVETYDMFFEVRCIQHGEKYSSATYQMYINTEVVSDKSLEGPTSGVAGTSYDYTLTAHSASGHAMEYQIYWGHGDGPGPDDWHAINPTTGIEDLSHTFPVDGIDHNYQVDYGVRCTVHNDVQEWDSIFVSIPGETITNHTLVGPAEGLVGVDYDFAVTGNSPDDHSLEYKFEWGDGFPTDWAPLTAGSATQSYHWAMAGEFTVKASVRCVTHNHVLSEKEQVVTITTGLPQGWIFGDGFESGDTEAWQ